MLVSVGADAMSQPFIILEILLTVRNVLIINTDWNDKMTKETN